jgi:choloylglycine hydrolase
LLKWLDRLFHRPPPSNSLLRFATAADACQRQAPGSAQRAVDDAFATLRAASSSATQWSIVFDIPNRQLHFRTKSNGAVRWLGFAALDFSCATAAQMMDIHEERSGDVSAALARYSHAKNLAHLEQALVNWGMDVSPQRVEAWVRHAEAFPCVE